MKKILLYLALFILFLVGFSKWLEYHTVKAYGTDFLFQVKCLELSPGMCDGKQSGSAIPIK